MILTALALVAAPTCAPTRVMSYNIRLDIASDGDNRWEKRRAAFIGRVALAKPQLLGLQEVVPGQLADLRAGLPDYRFSGRPRDDGIGRGEYSAVAFDTARYRWLGEGTFWLSATPVLPSRGWDAAFPRIASWVRLEDRADGARLLYLNTHLDHQGLDARAKGAAMIADWLRTNRRPDERLVVTGDFNSTPEMPALGALLGGKTALADARATSEAAPLGPEGTFNGFDPAPAMPPRIDYVLVGPHWRVKRYVTLDWNEGGRPASDHWPVIADLSPRDCAEAAASAKSKTAP